MTLTPLMALAGLPAGMVAGRTWPTRRAVLRSGSAGLVAGLAGCSAPFVDGTRPTTTVTPAPLPTVDAGSAWTPPVGAVVEFGPLSLLVTSALWSERATVLGTEIRVVDDDEFLAVETLFRNASDRYLAVDVGRYDVVHEEGTAEPIEPFAGVASTSFGGWAFAPGERRRVRLHYKLPPETDDVRLRGSVRVRSLPDDVVAVASLEVDLTSVAVERASLGGSLSARVYEVGEQVDAQGLAVAVRDVAVPVEVPNWTPPPGFEHLALSLSVTNGVEPGRPVVVALGRFGGLTVADPRGTEFTEDVWFDGTLAGERRYDSTGVPPGETHKGVLAVVVPVDTVPLYLFFTPPVTLWEAGTGVAVNRFVWRLR